MACGQLSQIGEEPRSCILQLLETVQTEAHTALLAKNQVQRCASLSCDGSCSLLSHVSMIFASKLLRAAFGLWCACEEGWGPLV